MTTFKITKDLIEDGKEDGTVRSSADITAPKSELVQRFRLYDDDGNRYYEGVMTSDAGFAPLRWGAWNAGCTYMELYDASQKTWEVL